jgi:hypothetical protein
MNQFYIQQNVPNVVRRLLIERSIPLEVGIFDANNVEYCFGFQSNQICNMKKTDPILVLLKVSISFRILVNSESEIFFVLKSFKSGL